MSTLRTAFVRNFVLIILAAMVGVQAFMLYDLSRTKEKLAASYISGPLETISLEMESFFSLIDNTLEVAVYHGRAGQFSIMDTVAINRYFAPILYQYPQISSMGVADKHGYEYDLIKRPTAWHARSIHYEVSKMANWSKLSFSQLEEDSTWTAPVQTDPRERPWHRGALKNPEVPFWTDPYIFNTHMQPGMTVSRSFPDPSAPDSVAILALDLTLEDLFSFTSKVQISENGFGFILNADHHFIEQPRDSTRAEYYTHAIELLVQRSESENAWEAFKFELNKEIWWAQFNQLKIANDHFFIVGVLVPGIDIMKEVQRTKYVIYIGMGTSILLILVLFQTHRQIARANLLLSQSNGKIREQSVLVQQKNIDILDSIHSAKRLQKAMLTPAEKIHRLLPHSFILYCPKDVVSGDFYWMRPKHEIIYFAVADCTGHGVPGAFMSIMGIDLLKVTLAAHDLPHPSLLLTDVRDQLIKRLVSEQMQPKDGMDMALCSFNKNTHILFFSGAMNNLFLIRSKAYEGPLRISTNNSEYDLDCHSENDTHQLFIIKADRIPISFTFLEQQGDFSEHSFKVLPQDTLYLTTDGFTDQFGGERGKKFGQRNFRNLLFALQSVPIEAQGDEMKRVFEEWRDGELQVDDVCVMGVRLMD